MVLVGCSSSSDDSQFTSLLDTNYALTQLNQSLSAAEAQTKAVFAAPPNTQAGRAALTTGIAAWKKVADQAQPFVFAADTQNPLMPDAILKVHQAAMDWETAFTRIRASLFPGAPVIPKATFDALLNRAETAQQAATSALNAAENKQVAIYCAADPTNFQCASPSG